MTTSHREAPLGTGRDHGRGRRNRSGRRSGAARPSTGRFTAHGIHLLITAGRAHRRRLPNARFRTRAHNFLVQDTCLPATIHTRGSHEPIPGPIFIPRAPARHPAPEPPPPRPAHRARRSVRTATASARDVHDHRPGTARRCAGGLHAAGVEPLSAATGDGTVQPEDARTEGMRGRRDGHHRSVPFRFAGRPPSPAGRAPVDSHRAGSSPRDRPDADSARDLSPLNP